MTRSEWILGICVLAILVNVAWDITRGDWITALVFTVLAAALTAAGVIRRVRA